MDVIVNQLHPKYKASLLLVDVFHTHPSLCYNSDSSWLHHYLLNESIQCCRYFFEKHPSVLVPKSPLQNNVGFQVPSILILLLPSPASYQTTTSSEFSSLSGNILWTCSVWSRYQYTDLFFPLIALLWSWPPLTLLLPSHSRSALSTKPQSPISSLNLILILVFYL